MGKQVYEIDGNNFSTYEGFCEEFTKRLNLLTDWNGNLDAFNDILYGGFGTPDEGFVLVWKNSEKSKNDLSYTETIKILEKWIQRCHPSNVEHCRKDLEQAKRNEGSTVFDWLLEIIQCEEHNDIELRLY